MPGGAQIIPRTLAGETWGWYERRTECHASATSPLAGVWQIFGRIHSWLGVLGPMSLRVPHSSAATSFTCTPFQSKSIFVTEGAETDFFKDFLVVYSNGATWACRIENNVMYNDNLTFTGERRKERNRTKSVHHPKTL